MKDRQKRYKKELKEDNSEKREERDRQRERPQTVNHIKNRTLGGKGFLQTMQRKKNRIN